MRKDKTMKDFKVGDIIQRKDIPGYTYRIIGEGQEWGGHWKVDTPTDKMVFGVKRRVREPGMVFKDDDRWEKAPGTV
jgi:hypothetical protein